MRVLYGVPPKKFLDVTSLFVGKENIVVPKGDDQRASVFGDPVPGVVKMVFVYDDYDNCITVHPLQSVRIDRDSSGKINCASHTTAMYTTPVTTPELALSPKSQDKLVEFSALRERTDLTPQERLKQLHAILQFQHGSLQEEYDEQIMACAAIPKDAVVLELGGNVGRNSCIIASLLNDSANLVVLESDPETAKLLAHNRDLNGFSFAVEDCALSETRLAQRGWDTKPILSTVPAGWTEVRTINVAELLAKYASHNFNTLVADCEGALFYILQAQPDFIKRFDRVLLENDFRSEDHKKYVDFIFSNAGLKCVYTRALIGSPFAGKFPKYCVERFFETWSRV